MNKKTGKIIIAFSILFVAAIVAVTFLMPEERTLAYHGSGTTGTRKSGTVKVILIDENGDPLSGGVFDIKVQRYNSDGSLFDDTDPGLAGSATIGELNLVNKYLDEASPDSDTESLVFDFDLESHALITLTETSAPEGYETVGPIVIDYYYQATDTPGTFEKMADIKSNPDGAAEKNFKESEYIGYGDFVEASTVIKIKNLPAAPKQTITIKKTWADDSESDRPEDLKAFVKYSIMPDPDPGSTEPPTPITEEVTTEGKTWNKNDSVWTATVEIPQGANVEDWGEKNEDVPDGYTFTKGSYVPDSYTCEITNTKLKTYTEEYVYDGELPEDVMKTIPTRKNIYYDGDKVDPESPSETTVEVGDDTYTFNGWTPESVTIDGANAKFVGTWTKTTKEKNDPGDHEDSDDPKDPEPKDDPKDPDQADDPKDPQPQNDPKIPEPDIEPYDPAEPDQPDSPNAPDRTDSPTSKVETGDPYQMMELMGILAASALMLIAVSGSRFGRRNR